MGKAKAKAKYGTATTSNTKQTNRLSTSGIIKTKVKTKAKASLTPPALTPAQAALSRGQRKRQAKRAQFNTRQLLIQNSLRLRNTNALGVTTLQHAIDSVDKEDHIGIDNNAPPAGAAVKVSTVHANQRRTLERSEAEHVDLVLQHPVFDADPFQAIQLHLKHTLPAASDVGDGAIKKNRRKR